MAGNRIKGITIEIEGNTTKLSDSLREVDDKLKTTQSALKDVNKLLKLDPKNTELLRQKQELLNKAIKDTEEKLKKEKEALEQLEKSGDKSPEALRQQEALKREIEATTISLNNYKKQLSDMPGTLDKFAASSKKVADNTKALSAAAAGVGAAMLGNAYNAAKTADDLATMAQQTGFSVEELQKFQYASDRVDVSVDAMAGSMKKLISGMKSGSSVFDKLGVSIYDANGEMRDATDVWYDSLEALSQIDNETERDTVAMELFGKSSAELAGIIDDGGAALKAFGQEAEDAGLILSGDAVSSAVEFNNAVDKLKASASQTFLEVGAALAEELVPALETLVEKIVSVLSWFSDLDGETQVIILTILGLIAAISPLAALFSQITTVVSGVSAALAFLVSPAGMVVVAIAAIVAAGIALYQNWDTIKAKASEIATSISDKFNQIKTSISNAINGAREAVSSAVSRIKSIMNFSWSLPSLKLPHISISGGFSLYPPSAPHFDIQWYRSAMENGMILNSPTIFGMQNGRLLGAGEAGSETVVGTNSLMNMIREASGENVVINVYPSAGMNEKQLALEVERVQVARINARKAVFG